MAKTKDKDLILELAETLSEKTVKSKVVSNVLATICKYFSFESGFIYEINQLNVFNLTEQWLTRDVTIRESFDVTEIPANWRHRFANEVIVHVDTYQNQDINAKEIGEIFYNESMYVASIIDEKTRISGLIVFIKPANLNPISESDKTILKIVSSMFVNYLDARVYQNRLIFAKTSLEKILDNTGIDIYVNDFNNHDILYANKSMAEPYGGISRFMGNKCWEVLFPGQHGPCEFCPQKNLIDENGEPTKVYTWDYQRAFDGSWFRVFSAAFRWVDGRLAHVVSSADITDNKRNEEMIEYLANFDVLTKLPNRRKLLKDCESKIDNAAEGEEGYLMFFDIDGFKNVNDTYGHDAGDEFLIQLGEFFSQVPMLKDSIYRNGGDEFVAIIDGEVTKANVEYLAMFIHERFKKIWSLKNGDIKCNVSIGVACYPYDGTTAEKLLAIADKAMYKVKDSGGAGVCFGEEL